MFRPEGIPSRVNRHTHSVGIRPLGALRYCEQALRCELVGRRRDGGDAHWKFLRHRMHAPPHALVVRPDLAGDEIRHPEIAVREVVPGVQIVEPLTPEGIEIVVLRNGLVHS